MGVYGVCFAEKEFKACLGLAADGNVVAGHVAVKRRVTDHKCSEMRLNGLAVIDQNAMDDLLVVRAQAVPIRRVSVRRAGRGKSFVVGKSWIEGPFGKRVIVVVAIVVEHHVRQLQTAAVLDRRALRLALRVKPLGVREAIVFAPVSARSAVYIKDSID